VAQAAGVTRGAVYWHFRDKADLYNAMMDRAVLPFEAHWLQAAADDGDDPLGRLRALLLDILRRIATDERLQRVLVIASQKVEYVGDLAALRDRHLHRREQTLRRIEALLRLASSSGQLAAGVSPRAAARVLHSLVDGLIRNWVLDREAYDLQRVGRMALDAMMAGLAAARAAA
jgi:TetR/AcrR family acrAB operon transcriptional repressor